MRRNSLTLHVGLRLAAVAALTASLVGGDALAVGGGDTITTVVGTGDSGFAGDGGPAREARLFEPFGMAVDRLGNLVIADTGNSRVRVAAFPRGGPLAGPRTIRTLAGTGFQGSGGDGGLASAATLDKPRAVALDAAGNVYIADSGTHRVRKVDPAGLITRFAGSSQGYGGDGGPAALAKLNSPWGLAVDAAGNVYIADAGNHRVRRVTQGGTISTVAGTGVNGFSGDGGAALSAQLSFPRSVAVDEAGNLYVSDTNNGRIRRISSSGTIQTIAGTGAFGSTGDGGLAVAARLADPIGLALDAAGNLYIADRLSASVRKVNPAGVISTVTGNLLHTQVGDEGPAEAAAFSFPGGAAVDGRGSLYVSDSGWHRIRMVVNTLPAPAFTATPVSGTAPLTVAFDASSSTDANGAILSYAWAFGGGATGSGRTASHTFQSAGTHTVTLTVMDDSGASRTAQRAIVVAAPGQPAPQPAPAPVPPKPRVLCDGRVATIVGKAGADRLVGTTRGDVIAALGGNDVVLGRGGNDIICGGTGADRIEGGAGSDRLLAGAGNDRIVGGGGSDHLYGGAGRDRLVGGPGRDRGDGGPGRDTCLTERKSRCP